MKVSPGLLPKGQSSFTLPSDPPRKTWQTHEQLPAFTGPSTYSCCTCLQLACEPPSAPPRGRGGETSRDAAFPAALGVKSSGRWVERRTFGSRALKGKVEGGDSDSPGHRVLAV